MRELAPGSADVREAITAINNLIRGRSNAAIEVTLTPGTTTTTVNHPNINSDSKPVLFPASASAASATGTWVTVTAAGVAVITHANAASTDRKFNMLLLGG